MRVQALLARRATWRRPALVARTNDLPSRIARVRLAEGDPAAAIARRWRRTARRSAERAWPDQELLALVVLALADDANGRGGHGRGTPRRGPRAGGARWPIRLFIDEGPPMARLLLASPSRGWHLAGLRPPSAGRVRRGGPAQAGARQLRRRCSTVARSRLAEPLSPRELEVLPLIAEGLTNQEIADRLFLSLHTVKAHARTIYAKLGVGSRTQAAAKARSLGLLPPEPGTPHESDRLHALRAARCPAAARPCRSPFRVTTRSWSRIRATTAGAADCELRRFDFAPWIWLPVRLAFGIRRPRQPVLGQELAGDVEAVGEAVTSLKPGDRVFAATGIGLGAYAEYICLREHPRTGAITTMPANLGYEEAAAIPYGGGEALGFLRKADVRSGQRVLVNGAGGTLRHVRGPAREGSRGSRDRRGSRAEAGDAARDRRGSRRRLRQRGRHRGPRDLRRHLRHRPRHPVRAGWCGC